MAPTRTMRHVVAALMMFGALGPALQAMAQSAHPASGVEANQRLFAVEIRTGPSWDPAKPPGEQAFFREHSAHLKRLRDAGHIVMGARYADKGLVVFTAKSSSDVKALMEQDPAMVAGTFVYQIHDFNVFYAGTVQSPPRR
jgi:uncharacterized protein YciI